MFGLFKKKEKAVVKNFVFYSLTESINAIFKLIVQNQPILLFCYFEDLKIAFAELLDKNEIAYQIIELPKVESQTVYLFMLDQFKTNSSTAFMYIGLEHFPLLSVENKFHQSLYEKGINTIYYYISFDDTILKLFSSDRLKDMMIKLGFKEGESISHNMVDNSIIRAQEKLAKTQNSSITSNNCNEWLNKNVSR